MLLQIFLRETDSLQFYAEKDTSVKPHENMRITNKVRYKGQLRGGVKPHENMRFTNKVRYKGRLMLGVHLSIFESPLIR